MPIVAGLSGFLVLVLVAVLMAYWKLLVFSISAFFLGYVLGAPSLEKERKDGHHQLNLLLERIAMGPPPTPLSLKPRSPSTISAGSTTIIAESAKGPLISEAVDARLDEMLERLVNSIISPWFDQLNRSRNREFYSCVRISINAAIQNLLGILAGQPTKDTLTVMLFGLTKALQLHLQEFRHFERISSTCDGAEDFLTGPHSHRPYYRTAQEEAEHLKQVSALLLKRLLPRQESRSINLNALLREVIGGNVLWGMLDRISDPDFINMEIVKRLQDFPDEPEYVEPGWNVVIIKVLKGDHMPKDDATTTGVCCMLHIAGRQVRTRRLRIDRAGGTEDCTWNEVFQFVLAHLKVIVQLLQCTSAGQYVSFGFAKIDLTMVLEDPGVPRQSWLRFKANGTANAGAGSGGDAQVFVETCLYRPKKPVVGPTTASPQKNHAPQQQKHPDEDAFNPPTTPNHLQRIEKTDDFITLEVALQNNDLFMEFHEFLNVNKAPPYLQFLMNVDGARQIAATELGLDPKDPVALDDWFRRKPWLDVAALERLRMLHEEARQIFNTHFTEGSKYRIELDPPILEETRKLLADSAKVAPTIEDTSHQRYVGGSLGPNVFAPAYKYVMRVLEEVYFPKFRDTVGYRRVIEHQAHYTTLAFTLTEDDKFSTTYSAESAPPPPSLPPLPTEQPQPAREQDDDLETKQISTAIVALRHQIAVLDEKLEAIFAPILQGTSAVGGTRPISTVTLSSEQQRQVEQYNRSKKELNAQINGLIALLNANTPNSASSSDNLSSAAAAAAVTTADQTDDQLWLDLHDTRVTIQKATEGTGLFDVCTRSQSSDQVLAVVTRSFEDFVVLRRELRIAFPRISKLPFPSSSGSSSSSKVCQLEAFLSLLITDQFIRRAIPLRKFLTLDGKAQEGGSASGVGGSLAASTTFAAGQFVDAVVGKRVRGVFKSAASTVFGSAAPEESQGKTRFYETRERHTTSDLRNPPINIATATPPSNKSPPMIRRSHSGTFSASEDKSKHQQKDSGTDSLQLYTMGDFTESEVEMLIELAFDFVAEAFDLQEPDQWFRRKLFGVFKQFLKQTYGDTLGRGMSDLLNKAFQEDSVLWALQKATELLWEDGIFIKDRPPPVRSAEQKLATAIEARTLFIKKTPGLLQRFAGRYNAICGMTRIFNMLQHREFNRLLLITILDIIVKVVFTDQVR